MENSLILLEFYSDTCRPCKMMMPLVEEAAKKKGISIKKTEVGRDRQNAEKFGIRSVPTLVLLKDGQEIKRLTGLVSERRLDEFLEL